MRAQASCHDLESRPNHADVWRAGVRREHGQAVAAEVEGGLELL